jgi:hypothetical protein
VQMPPTSTRPGFWIKMVTLYHEEKVTSPTVSGGGSAWGSMWRTHSLFIDIAMVLWAWTIEPAKDEKWARHPD